MITFACGCIAQLVNCARLAGLTANKSARLQELFAPTRIPRHLVLLKPTARTAGAKKLQSFRSRSLQVLLHRHQTRPRSLHSLHMRRVKQQRHRQLNQSASRPVELPEVQAAEAGVFQKVAPADEQSWQPHTGRGWGRARRLSSSTCARSWNLERDAQN